MLETYDPDLELHLSVNNTTFDQVVEKSKSILEQPEPLNNYQKRVAESFRNWLAFKKAFKKDLETIFSIS